MFAVFESGGKQHRVSEGDVVRVEKIAEDLGKNIVFDSVLLIADGNDVRVGQPFLPNGKVAGEIVDQARTKKISVVKFKRRKNYLRMGSHRQNFTTVKITSISE